MSVEERSSDRASSRLVIGTAGHVDHGKTSLVRVLSGVNTDRLPEEKSRGISIELGFAPLTLPDGRRAAVVDVPGHERFLRTMVAGVTGVDLVLLVIAADEGVMPQTREHLDVCALLGLRRGLVALSKVDLVDPQLLALAIDDVRSNLRGTFLEDAVMVPFSSVTGEGLEALRAALAGVASELVSRSPDGPARLPIDRVFTVKGAGTVVTGTMAGGRLETGQSVTVLPGRATARVRGIEVHGEKRTVTFAGERAALNLAGLDREALSRGVTVSGEGEVLTSTSIDVELTWLSVCPAPLARRARLLLHALATQEIASVSLLGDEQLRPGATGFARIRVERGVALLPGDRFVLRGFRTLPGHGTTVGGGRVIRVHGSTRGGRERDARQLVERMAAASDQERILLEIQVAGAAGLSRPALPARTGLGAAVVERSLSLLLREERVVLLGRDPGRLVARAELERIEKMVLDRLAALHGQGLPGPGISREALRTSTPTLAHLDASVFAQILERLALSGVLELAAELVRHENFSGRAAPAPSDLESRVAATLSKAGLSPPFPQELASALGLEVSKTAQALEILLRRGEAVRVGNLFFARRVIDELRERLRAFLIERGAITTQEMKALVGGSRKYAIPLAEYFDAEKLTLRVGELRRLRLRPGVGGGAVTRS
jgi:selenocysteine-specific elongation factor